MKTDRQFRLTSQRQIILEELQRARCHPTADEIYQRVRKRLPRVSLGTIYRNLETLAAQGMIRKLDLVGSQKRFDVTLEDHCHVRCLRCGRVDDVFFTGALPVDEMFTGLNDYQICEVRFELVGYCPDCRVVEH